MFGWFGLVHRSVLGNGLWEFGVNNGKGGGGFGLWFFLEGVVGSFLSRGKGKVV